MNFIAKAMAAPVNTGGLELSLHTTSDMTLGGLIGVAVSWISIIAGVLAFFFLVYSGILYLTAGGNPDAVKKGQQGLLNAIIGLVIIALAWGVTTALVSQLGQV